MLPNFIALSHETKLARARRKQVLIAKGLSLTRKHVFASKTKLARARRKQVLIAKGLSQRSTVGKNLYFHFPHNKTNSTIYVIY